MCEQRAAGDTDCALWIPLMCVGHESSACVTEDGAIYAWGKHNMSKNLDDAAHPRPMRMDPMSIDTLALGKQHGLGGPISESQFVHGRYPSPTLLRLWKQAVPAGMRNPWDPADRSFPHPGSAATQREGQPAGLPRKMSGSNHANTYDHSMSISQLRQPPSRGDFAPTDFGNDASELYKRDLENAQLQQSRDKAHYESQVAAIRSEHAEKLLQEVGWAFLCPRN